jgi:aminoglycoside 2'-N-acetyltransferase I
MRMDVVEGDAGWALAEALDAEVYPPEAMARIVWRDVVWAHADKRIIGNVENAVVCHVGIFLRDGTLNGQFVKIGGIGGVMTANHARKKGYAGEAMRLAGQFFESKDVDFALLFCEAHHEHFYERLGWRKFSGNVFAEQPEGRKCFDLMAGMLLPLRKMPVDGLIDLCGFPW